MSPWQATDIRRNLPEYRTREGDDVYNAPYRATEVDLNAFVLKADTSTLQVLIDQQLNHVLRGHPPLLGSQQELEFACVDDWIILIFASFSSLSSVDRRDRSQGSVSAYEVSVWVPIIKRQMVAGAVLDKAAWFLPLVYTAPTASVAAGREVYGYPKVPAFLSVPKDGGPPDAVELRETLTPGREVARPRFLQVQDTKVAGTTGWDLGLLAQPLLRNIVGRFFGNSPLIFRKQAGIHGGHAELYAGYTALIESKVPITRLRSLNPLAPSPDCVVNVLDANVTASLGIKEVNPLHGVAVRGCTLDVQSGSEIWVARDEQPYVAPMRAPGNDLMRGFEARDAYDLRRQTESEQAGLALESPNALGEIPNATAEAYFVRPRPNAIKSLLARHFPSGLGERTPTVDAERQFIVLTLVRANVVADNVRLYELSVMVPVMHQGERCWYVPYMFRSPGAAVIHAREWFGHPCQQAFIEFKDDSSERSVFVNQPRSFGPQAVRWVREQGIVIAPKAPEDTLGVELAEKFLLGEQRIVGLLQARHAADTTRACFQAVVCSGRRFEAHGDVLPTTGHISLHSGLRLGRLLDLESEDVAPGARFRDLEIITTLPTWCVGGAISG